MSNQTQTQTVRKLTVKSIGAQPDIKEIIAHDTAHPGEIMDLCTIIGRVNKVKPGESDYGPFCRFLGLFKGVNLRTGEVFRSSACLLPKAIEEEIEAAFGMGDVSSLDFGYKIGAKYDKTVATGYIYVVQSLLAPSELDPIEMLEKSMNLVALPAPAKAADVDESLDPIPEPAPAPSKPAASKKGGK